jgi:YggT family protein
MSFILLPFYNLFDTLLTLYFWVLILSVVLSWLLAFGVVNTSNQLVSTLSDFLFRVTEPALRPIRKILPNFGGIDLSPIVLILALNLFQNILRGVVLKLMGVPI